LLNEDISMCARFRKPLKSIAEERGISVLSSGDG
jgi:hypothetical protein